MRFQKSSGRLAISSLERDYVPLVCGTTTERTATTDDTSPPTLFTETQIPERLWFARINFVTFQGEWEMKS